MPYTCTFLELIKKYSVKIPRIQRDYAQGRLTPRATEIRKSIIDTIVTVLADDNRTKDFNFIYGSTKNGCFIPLDGQQRLTTLFLLHFYLEGMMSKIGETVYHFSYVTRQSSTRFCEHLVKNGATITAEIRKQYSVVEKRRQAEKEKNSEALKALPQLKTPSEIIRNQEWYFSQWDADPTISGMLVMLDEIHSRYISNAAEVEKAYDRLFNQNALKFQFQPLDDFTRTDDLFIKMNSRGLDLSDFEIFKSKLVEDFEHLLPAMQKDFKNNIDGGWGDFLWSLRSQVANKAASHSVDIIYERLLKFIIPAEAAALGQNLSTHEDELFERNKKSMRFAHNAYLADNITFSKELLTRIHYDLNYLCSQSTSPLSSGFVFSSDQFDVKKDFSSLLLAGEQPKYHDTVMIFAWLRFDQLSGQNDLQRKRWLKVISSISMDSYVDSAEVLANALKGIELLITSYINFGDNDVYKWLAKGNIPKPAGLSSYQIQEEIAKAQLRQLDSDHNWNTEIDLAENDSFMNGQIGFIMECAGIASEANTGTGEILVLDYESLAHRENILFTNFISYRKKIVPLVAHIKDGDSVIDDYLLVKAMLNQGDYLLPANNKYQIANKRDGRDYSWHALLNIGNRHTESRIVFKRLLDHPDYNPYDIPNTLKAIAAQPITGESDWRHILSGPFGEQILQRARQGYLDFQNDDADVRILHTSQLNGFHDEMYSLLLFLHFVQDERYPTKKEFITYESVKSNNDDAGILISKIFNNNIETLKITHWEHEWRFIYSEHWPRQYRIKHNQTCSIDRMLEHLYAY